ncbi:polymeric immunoglobulin receptor-like [Podargus strigoides]
MELRVLLLLLLLCCPGLHAPTTDTEESRSEGSTLDIQCPYSESVVNRHKAWRHWREGQWETLVQTTTSAQPPYIEGTTQGKFTIKDNHTLRTMSITMRNLQVEDSGTYSCGYYPSTYGYAPLKLIPLNVFKGQSLAQVPSSGQGRCPCAHHSRGTDHLCCLAELYRSELDSLSVQCPYSPETHSTDIKVWCRTEREGLCTPLARTDSPSTRGNNQAWDNRAAIQDDTQKRTVTVTMEKLQDRDTGVYWCALLRRSDVLRIMEVRLTVSKRTQQHTAYESGNVSVQCPYNASRYGDVSKAWCKEGTRKACNILVSTNLEPSGYRRRAQQGRVTIQDDTQLGTVTITMEKLQAQDSGVYWCALHEHTRPLRMVEVTLSVSQVFAGTSQPTPSGNTPPPSLSSNVDTFILLSVILSILFILAVISLIILCVRQCKHLKRKGTGQAENTYDKPEDIAQLDSTERMESLKDDSKDLKYVTLNFQSRLNPEDPLYCNVESSQTHRKPSDEHVEYATIALKQLPTNDK